MRLNKDEVYSSIFVVKADTSEILAIISDKGFIAVDGVKVIPFTFDSARIHDPKDGKLYLRDCLPDDD